VITVDIPRAAPVRWQALLSVTNAVLRRSARISCTFVSSQTIRTLNRRYRGKNRPTNVLSFGWESSSGDVMGDVVLCRSVIRAEVKSVQYNNHLDHLFVHGILHVLGYDHERPTDVRKMEALEKKILARDPYQS